MNTISIQGSPAGALRPAYFWAGVAAVTAVYLLLSLSKISEVPFPDPDEPRYAGAGRTMSRDTPERSLLVPQFNGEPRINKPPLFYWLVALSNTIAGGSTEASSRAPSVVMGLLMLWGTIWLGTRMFGHTTGMLAGMVLLSTPLFIALSRCCITDMTLSTFVAAAFGFLLSSVNDSGARNLKGWIAAIFLGLAVLTKATPALALVLGVAIFRALELPPDLRPRVARFIPWMLVAAIVFSALAIYSWHHAHKTATSARVKAIIAAQTPETDDDAEVASSEHKKQVAFYDTLDHTFSKIALACIISVLGLVVWMAFKSERLSPILPPMWKAGLAVALMMGLWWYALLIYGQGWPRFKELLSFELNSRLAGAMHREGFHYYFLIIPAIFFPWSIGLPASLRAAWPQNSARTPQDHADIFLLGWLLGVVFFFSIPGAKLSTYMLPAMPASALLMARYLVKLNAACAWNSLTRGLAAVIALALLFLPVYCSWLPQNISGIIVQNPVMAWTACILLALAFCGSWFLATSGRGRTAGVAICGGAVMALFLILPVAAEKLNERSSKDVCLAVKDSLRDCARVQTMGVAAEGLSYYLDRRITEHLWKPPVDRSKPAQILFDLLGDTESSALFVDQRFFPRLFGKDKSLAKLSANEIWKLLPDKLEYVYSDYRMFVVKNKIKK